MGLSSKINKILKNLLRRVSGSLWENPEQMEWSKREKFLGLGAERKPGAFDSLYYGIWR
jgi:hypothetical protein